MTTKRFITDISWDQWKPKEKATVVYIIQDQKILLIRRKRGLGIGKICGPGGKVEHGESLLECAKRETKEEVCLLPEALKLCGKNTFQFSNGYGLIVYIYKGSMFSGTAKETDEAEPFWQNVTQIPFDKMWADSGLWFPMMLNNRLFEGHYLFDGDEIIDYQLVERNTLED